MSIQDFKLKNKNIKVKRYVIDPGKEPTAIVFGKFAPFTGSKGHGKLIDFAKDNFKNVVIISPTRNFKDKKVDIFTDDQKEYIIRQVNPDIKFYRISSNIPIRMFTQIVDLGYDRPVLIIGKDREKEFTKFFIKYDKNNEAITNMDDKNFGKGEYLVISRDEKDTSATKVREALINNDKEKFKKITGYDDKIWNMMQKMLKKGG
jgi:hypothetical protein